jgi:hypothetical protein
MFRPAEMVKVYCLFRKAHLENILSSLQKIGCVQFFDVKKEYDLSPPKIDELDISTDCLERLDQLLSEFSPKTESSILKKLLGPRTVPLCVLEIKPAKASKRGKPGDTEGHLFEMNTACLARASTKSARRLESAPSSSITL